MHLQAAVYTERSARLITTAPVNVAYKPRCTVMFHSSYSGCWWCCCRGVWITAVAHVNSINDVPKITDTDPCDLLRTLKPPVHLPVLGISLHNRFLFTARRIACQRCMLQQFVCLSFEIKTPAFVTAVVRSVYCGAVRRRRSSSTPSAHVCWRQSSVRQHTSQQRHRCQCPPHCVHCRH